MLTYTSGGVGGKESPIVIYGLFPLLLSNYYCLLASGILPKWKKKSLFVFCHFNGLISLIALTSLNYSLLNPSPSSLHQNCQSDLPHLTLIFPPRSSTPSRWHCHFPHLPFLTPISMAPRFPHFHFSFPFRPTSRFLQCSSWSINHPYYPIYKICVLDLNFFNWFFSFVLQSLNECSLIEKTFVTSKHRNDTLGLLCLLTT